MADFPRIKTNAGSDNRAGQDFGRDESAARAAKQTARLLLRDAGVKLEDDGRGAPKRRK